MTVTISVNETIASIKLPEGTCIDEVLDAVKAALMAHGYSKEILDKKIKTVQAW